MRHRPAPHALPAMTPVGLAACLLLATPAAFAGPQGAVLVSGQATVKQPSATQTDIVQTSPRAVIDWRRLGYEVEVSLRFTLDKTNPRAFDEFIVAARDVPEVIAIETFLGRVDVRLNVIARDMGHWTGIYRDRILTLPHIAEVEALMLVSTIKETAGLAL